MIIIQRDTTNPYFNIAAEEYLIKSLGEPCFMLWQNNPSVIIGKHQNTVNEVNLQFCKDNDIPVIRRISGGGTVYHDHGNLNYSFIDMGKAESLVNFEKYSQPIIELLQSLKINASLVGKSDLKIDGKKFSGNASHVYRNKVLHHGTLLFNSNLSILNESIKIKHNNIIDKAVKSNRSTVTNISEYLNGSMTINEFKNLLSHHIQKIFPAARLVKLSEKQIENIETLAKEKYHTWEWNFGYGPKYQIESSPIIKGKIVHFKTMIVKGFVDSYDCNSLLQSEVQDALNFIKGKQHQIEIINQELKGRFSPDTISLIINILF